MLLKTLVSIFILGISTQVSTAQGLSARDCADIYTTYGVKSAGCPENSFVMNQEQPLRQNWAQQPTAAEKQSHVFFRRGGTSLDREARIQIESLAQLLNTELMQTTCLMLVGHSDSIGGKRSNMRLSAARTATVQKALQSLMIAPDRLRQVTAMGEDAPLSTMSPHSPWQRRVEIRAKNCAAN